jgi:hypothetical protein
MLRVFAPVGVAVLAIAVLTGFQIKFSNRFNVGTVTAEEFSAKFSKVPMTIGSWVGTDMEVDPATLEQAGAVEYVSRRYVNTETKQEVDLWLIVGHSRDICRHTPDICYPSQGFSQLGERVPWNFDDDSNPDHPPKFFTAKFRSESNAGSSDKRVFWAWNGNTEGQDRWDAPEPKTWFDWLPFKSPGPKVYYGNNSALYKMYFTTTMAGIDEDVADNVANDFAELMLPQIDRALFPERFAGEAPLAAPTATPADAAGKMPEDATEAAPAAEPAEPATAG